MSTFAAMQVVDTHTHLYSEDFTTDQELLINEAIVKGVNRFCLPNIDSSTVDVMLELVRKYPSNCFPMMGLHPTSVKENYKDELEIVEKRLSEKKFIAVGEIGIDLYWDKTFLKEQQDAFRRQIEIANHYKLPVSIHSRESFEEIYEILIKTKKESPFGAFHCFTGTAEQAQRAIDLGFVLGVGGVVTFKNGGVAETIAGIDLQHLVLETDAPYLPPVPFRGKRNVPVYILKVVEKIAEIKNITVEEVAAITTATANKIFSFESYNGN